MRTLEGDFGLVEFLGNSNEGFADPANEEAQLELYRAKQRIAEASGQFALFDVIDKAE